MVLGFFPSSGGLGKGVEEGGKTAGESGSGPGSESGSGKGFIVEEAPVRDNRWKQ